MKKTVLVLLTTAILSSCGHHQPNKIYYKSLLTDNPHLARFSYQNEGCVYEFIDSTNRYSIGDDVTMYSNK